MESRSWSRLPDLALDQIFHRLDLIDFIRFGAVCKPYQVFMNAHRNGCEICPKISVPWLVISPRPRDPPINNNMYASFYILGDVHNRYKFSLPATVGNKFLGASGRFLITEKDNTEIFIIDPITREQHSLPLASPLVNVVTELELGDPLEFNWLGTPSAINIAPNSHHHLTLAIGYAAYWAIAIARPGDDVWGQLDIASSTRSSVRCACFHKNHLYVVFNSFMEIHDLDRLWEDEYLPFSLHLPLPFRNGLRDYLVESIDGQYLFVVREEQREETSSDQLEGDSNATGMHSRFRVFRLDENRNFREFSAGVDAEGHNGWDEVDAFEDVSLFLGILGNSSFFFRSPTVNYCSHFGLATNCIYFYDSGNVGEFNMLDKTIKFINLPSQVDYDADLWFAPIYA